MEFGRGISGSFRGDVGRLLEENCTHKKIYLKKSSKTKNDEMVLDGLFNDQGVSKFWGLQVSIKVEISRKWLFGKKLYILLIGVRRTRSCDSSVPIQTAYIALQSVSFCYFHGVLEGLGSSGKLAGIIKRRNNTNPPDRPFKGINRVNKECFIFS